MCGIAGIWTRYQTREEVLNFSLGKMCIHQTRPDSSDYGLMPKGIGLAHQRLSILGLSAGNQPMISNKRRYVLSFNGEIYNHKDLRYLIKEHLPFTVERHSDTETLLTSIEIFGLEKL